jgi:hypothetical protein
MPDTPTTVTVPADEALAEVLRSYLVAPRSAYASTAMDIARRYADKRGYQMLRSGAVDRHRTEFNRAAFLLSCGFTEHEL